MRRRKIITITAGTPIRVTESKCLASSFMVQPKVSASGGVVYVIMGVPAADTPVATEGIELVAAPTNPSFPPFSYIVPDPFSGERVDMNELCIDGAHTGDKVLVTWWEILA